MSASNLMSLWVDPSTWGPYASSRESVHQSQVARFDAFLGTTREDVYQSQVARLEDYLGKPRGTLRTAEQSRPRPPSKPSLWDTLRDALGDLGDFLGSIFGFFGDIGKWALVALLVVAVLFLAR